MRRLSIALFILRDMYRLARAQVIGIGFLGLVSSTARLGVAGLLLQFIGGYARSEGGPALDLLGFDLGIAADASRAWLWIGVIAGLAFFGTALDYAYIYGQLHIGRRFAHHAADQALDALRDRPNRPNRAADPGGFVRGSGAILGSIAPAIETVVFGAIMFTMRPALSGVMAVASLIFLGPLTIALGDRILGATQRKRSTSRNNRNDSDVALLSSGPLYADGIRRDAWERSRNESSGREIYKAIFDIRTSQQMARAAGAAFTSIGAIVLAVGLTVVEQPGANDVGALLAYAIVAQFTFRAVAQIGVNAVQFNRYLPTYESYVGMRRANGADESPPTEPAHAGEVWWVTQRRAPAAWVLDRWLPAIDLDGQTRAAIALGPDHLPNGIVRDVIGGGRADSPRALERCQDFLAVALGRSLRDDDLFGPVDELSSRNASPVSKRAAIALSAAVLQPDPLVLICPAKLLIRLDRSRQQDTLEALSRHHVVVVGNARRDLMELADRVIDGSELPSFEVVDDDDEDDVA